MRDIRVEAPLILDLDATQFHFDRGQVSLFVVYDSTAQSASLGLLYSSVAPLPSTQGLLLSGNPLSPSTLPLTNILPRAHLNHVWLSAKAVVR